MQPSRRATLGLVGAALAVPLAGCSAPGTPSGDGEATDRPAGTAARSSLEVRLTGPDTDRLLFDGSDVARVGSVRERGGSVALRVALTDDATSDVRETARAVGLDDDPDAFEVVQTRDGEVTGRFGVTSELAEAIAAGEWDGEFLLVFERREDAAELRDALARDTPE